MTTFVGKDVTIELDVDNDGTKEVLDLVKEISIEINNGRKEIKALGYDTWRELNWTGKEVSGTLTIVPSADTNNASLDNLFDLVLPSGNLPTGYLTDPDMLVKFGSTPTYTLTLTNIGFGSLSFSVGMDDVIAFELPFVGQAATIT